MERKATDIIGKVLDRLSDAELDEIRKAVHKASCCPSCGAEPSHWSRQGELCFQCADKAEAARWAALSIEQKLDELKTRMDAAGPALRAMELHIPIGGG